MSRPRAGTSRTGEPEGEASKPICSRREPEETAAFRSKTAVFWQAYAALSLSCQNGAVAYGKFRQAVLLIAAFGAGYLLAHTDGPDSSTRTPRRVSRPVMVTPLVNELEEEAERLRTEVAILQATLEEERSQSQSDEPASDSVKADFWAPAGVVVVYMNGDGLRVLERHKAAALFQGNSAIGAGLLRTQR